MAMKRVIEFLSDLQQNNNRPWFDAHKARYREANEIFNRLTGELIAAIGTFDPSIRGLTAKECTYRIYRDTRFSPDKTPYKTHLAAYICRGGKKSSFGGYYFHVEPAGSGMLGGNLLVSGIYMPEPNVLRSLREEILDHGNLLEKNIEKAAKEGFELDRTEKLQRVPAGFPPDSPFAEYLKLKNLYLEQAVDNNYLLQPNLAERSAEAFRATLDFLNQLNRAVEYALETV